MENLRKSLAWCGERKMQPFLINGSAFCSFKLLLQTIQSINLEWLNDFDFFRKFLLNILLKKLIISLLVEIRNWTVVNWDESCEKASSIAGVEFLIYDIILIFLNFRDYNAIMCFSMDVKCWICLFVDISLKVIFRAKVLQGWISSGQLKAHALSDILNSSKLLPYSECTSAAWWQRNQASHRRTGTRSSLEQSPSQALTSVL